MSDETKPVYEFGPFRVVLNQKLLFRDGHPVRIKPKVFDLLLIFVQNSGRLIEKEELIERLWPDSYVEEGNLAVTIFALRKALKDGSNGELYVETVPRRGYRFTVTARKRFDEADNKTDRGGNNHTPAVAESRALAVLPFKPIGTKTDDEYLGLGIADAVITRLSSIRGIRVRPTSAVQQYIRRREEPFAVGREMKVDLILDGNIQRSGKRLRATVQLVNVSDNLVLWAAKYDQEITNIFYVEDSISEKISEALALRISDNRVKQSTKRHTENTEAYQAYLKANYFLGKRTPAAFRHALKYFEQAISIDPNYALAYAGLAEYYRLNGGYFATQPKKAWEKSREVALRSLEIDDSVAEAHAVMAHLLIIEWDWAGAETEARRAMELTPNCLQAIAANILYFRITGQFEEALALSRRSLELDPLSLPAHVTLASTLFMARRYEQAIDQLMRVLEMDPKYANAHFFLGLTYASTERYDEAISEYKEAIEVCGPDLELLMYVVQALAASGKKREALALLQEVNESMENNSFHYYNSIIYATLFDKDNAIASLEKAYEERDQEVAMIKIYPFFDNLRDDPKFHSLIERVGLAF